MKTKISVALLILVLCASCTSGSATEPAVQVVTQVVVQEITSTPEPPNPTAVATEALVATEAPAATEAPTNFAVSAELIEDADCRLGPSTSYPIVASFTKGQVVEIVGRTPDSNNTWWIVVVPGDGGACRLSSASAVVTGDTANLDIDQVPSVPSYDVQATLVKDADCRSGPGTSYDAVASFKKGVVLEVVGRNPDFNNTWWLVFVPLSVYSQCWLSFNSALAEGNFGSLPIVTPVTPEAIYNVQARLIKDSNCRTGPGTSYDVAALLEKDMVVEIIGRNPDFNNTWWVVKLPDSPITCWLSIASALATGNFGSLPTVEPP